jgi:cardiolipin synthase A/B
MHVLPEFWPYLVAGATFAATLLAAAHAVLYKRDVRASIGWVGLILIAPGVGALIYLFLGVNRIKRRARARMIEGIRIATEIRDPDHFGDALAAADLGDAPHLDILARVTGDIVSTPLVAGNSITPLDSGDEAYPAMLDAIHHAERSVSLGTYIFDNDPAGERFVATLAAAVARGVSVRVLIDDVGARYSFPSVAGRLQRAGIPTARFMRTLLPWRFPYFNLRNHRKLLVIDGRVAFTGGINIREGHVLGHRPSHPVRDLHFRVEGPVVRHCQAAFVQDWRFATKEVLHGRDWFPALEQRGSIAARGLIDGPDEDFDRIRMTLLGALACARRSVRIMTPYFLPDNTLIMALNTTAMRGVKVEILMPEKNNLFMVKWASAADQWQLLEWGCKLYFSNGTFDHSKLMVVDDAFVLLGSANWDPRSLRLNFEFNLECFDAPFGKSMAALFDARVQSARALTKEEVHATPLPHKMRNGIARLFSPYL